MERYHNSGLVVLQMFDPYKVWGKLHEFYTELENNSILSYLSSSGTLLRYNNTEYVLTVVGKLIVDHAQSHKFYLQDERNRFLFAYKDNFIPLKLLKIIDLSSYLKKESPISHPKHLLILSPSCSLLSSNLTNISPSLTSPLTLLSSPFGILSRIHYENSIEIVHFLASTSESLFLTSGRSIPGTDGGTVYNSSMEICGIAIETDIESILCIIHIVMYTQKEVILLINSIYNLSPKL